LLFESRWCENLCLYGRKGRCALVFGSPAVKYAG
jgi:hypothetical protein